MGSFGYGVLDNDEALDLVVDVTNLLHNGLISTEPNKVRLAASIVLNGGLAQEIDFEDSREREMCVVAWEALTNIPDKWYLCWSDPSQIRDSVGKLIQGFEEYVTFTVKEKV